MYPYNLDLEYSKLPSDAQLESISKCAILVLLCVFNLLNYKSQQNGSKMAEPC
jgi:hypothetical protein